ncbi:hypothetical protein VTO73DRAFT_8560 [Trametes versicolor]
MPRRRPSEAVSRRFARNPPSPRAPSTDDIPALSRDSHMRSGHSGTGAGAECSRRALIARTRTRSRAARDRGVVQIVRVALLDAELRAPLTRRPAFHVRVCVVVAPPRARALRRSQRLYKYRSA